MTAPKVLAGVALALLYAGCTRDSMALLCIPGEQQACACPGGPMGAQACNSDGTGYQACLGCPGGPTDDLGQAGGGDDLAVPPPGSDLAATVDDLAMTVEDLAFPPGSDLAGLDFAQLPPDLDHTDFSVPGTPCAVVMILLDRSGSMGDPIDGTFGGGTTKLEAAKAAIEKMVMSYGWRVPFGFTTFNIDNSGVCTSGIDILVDPALGTYPQIELEAGQVMLGGGTNTGEAIDKLAADPKLHDAARQGSYVLLLTDGQPNCNPGDTPNATFTIAEITKANGGATPIKTFVVGLGQLGAGDITNLDGMGNAGGEGCTDGFCGGHAYYPGGSVSTLDRSLDLVMNQIVGSAPGGSCGNFACFPSGAACGSGQSCCGTNGCKSLSTDPGNCGGCDNSCGTGATCAGGHCLCGGKGCPTGDRCCGGTCCSQLDMSAPPDLSKPPPPTDLANLPACVCSPACIFPGGCVAANCCQLTMTCTPTPALCNPS